MKIGDKVRLTDKAILECRELFGKNAKWQKKDREKEYEVFGVKEIPEHPNIIVLIENKDKRKLIEICETHLEISK